VKINHLITNAILFFIINSFVFTVIYLWQNDMIMPNQDFLIQKQNGK